MQRILKTVTNGFFLLLSACGNPGGISDEDYAEYQQLGAPKILYSCTTEVKALMKCVYEKKPLTECMDKHDADETVEETETGYSAGVGINATYNHLLKEAKSKCDGDFKIHDSEQ